MRNIAAYYKYLMSTRVTVSVGFYFEKEHYAQLHAYLPRTEALKIPQLNCQDN